MTAITQEHFLRRTPTGTFIEYFHGDNGSGLGASDQTGWTGVVARLMHLLATTTPEQVLELGKLATTVDVEPVVSA